ncbi:MAG: 1-acyl-sn-glycerol-3-phosphate acyltransferase, partial [Gammaproteobacteria bacterium]
MEALKQAPEKKNCLLIGNHISWADPIITHGLLGTYLPQRRYLIKESLTYIPLFGQALVSVGMPYIS